MQPSRSEEGRQPGHQAHVLLVDDDALMRTLARTLLEKSGFNVSEAVDGAQALRCLDAGDVYDVVVLDLYMPEVGGDEVLRYVRSNTKTADLPVIILTGSEGGEMEAILLDQGADDYIRKPIDPQGFISSVRGVLDRDS
ncbi:MAG: response regulator [Gemmatimonadota bacterium]|nr:MAG: response regulator [Gemmatimonadota bacterium]